MTVEDIGGARVLVVDPDGPPLTGERDAVDLIGEALGASADWLAIPLSRLPPDFLKLSTGLAGAVLQKAVNYRINVALIGDVSDRTAASKPLADFVRESNRGRQVWFVDSLDAFRARLAGG